MMNKRKKREIFPTSYHGFPYSLFATVKIVTGIALVIGFPFLITDFTESINGYFKIILLYGVSYVSCYIIERINER